MNFSELCIRRPAFTVVLSLMITIIGIMSYVFLPVRWIPEVNSPEISIYTTFPGASASLIESQITLPIETSLSGVDGIKMLSSFSKQGVSQISVKFKLGKDLTVAAEDIRSALEHMSDTLPTDVRPPQIMKSGMNNLPVLWLSFSDEKRSSKGVGDYLEQFVMPQLQTVEGVSAVMTYGERTSAMRIWLDPQKMAASNVTASEISQMISDQNVEVPSGQIRTLDRFYSVITDEKLKTAEQFNNLIIRNNQNQIVRLKDIGEAKIDAASFDSSFRVGGKPAVALGIVAQSSANPLDVSRNILKSFNQIIKSLPQGMKASVVFDQSTFIRASIHSVFEALLEATILVLIVILLFLANVRAALIPIVTIPVCLISTFALLYFLGFSIDVLTLMAFVLAIGLVVDDAIVMLENIMRHIETGLEPFKAAIQGSREIIFPIIAMTLTLAAVYAPVAFTSGVLGKVLKEFSFTLAGTVLISGFVALTLSPMMCSRLLRKQATAHAYESWVTAKFQLLQEKYQQLLMWVLQKRSWIVGSMVGTALLGAVFFHFIPSELAPMEDMDEVDIYFSAPRNASFEFTDYYAKQLESIYQKVPELVSDFSEVGSWVPSKGFQMLILKPRSERKRSATQISAALDQELKSISGVKGNAFAPPPPLTWFASEDGSTIGIALTTSQDYKTLNVVAQQFMEEAKKYKGFSDVNSDLKWDGEQFEVNIDREKASDLQVSMQNITNTISTLLAGKKSGHFEYGGKRYDIIMQMNQSALANPNILAQLYVRNNAGKMIPMSDLISMQVKTGPERLPHVDRLRADTISIDLKSGYTVGNAVKELQRIAQKVLPDDVKYTFVGAARDYIESNGTMAYTFLLALVFIYLILVAQFESFIDPFIILLTVPFAVIGALITLKLAGGSLNIYSNIGLVTLIGLIAKHGILITEFANRMRCEGQSIIDAVTKAAALRLRPILMTTAAMVLGALPLALASGPGCETRQQIGWVIVGGLFFGTFFSLIVVPVAYTFLARFKKVNATTL